MDINRFVNITMTVHRRNCAIDWTDDVSIHAQLIRAVRMQNVRQLIMELSAVVRMDLLEIHISSVIEFKVAVAILNVHPAKHVLMANVVHHANVEYRLCVKL